MASDNDTQRLFLSDLHLESPDSPQFRGLARLLGTHPAREIYLLEKWGQVDEDLVFEWVDKLETRVTDGAGGFSFCANLIRRTLSKYS